MCKEYWDAMEEDTCAFIHMESTTTSFCFILKGQMGSGVGVIRFIKGASGERHCYTKTYNSSTWNEVTA